MARIRIIDVPIRPTITRVHSLDSSNGHDRNIRSILNRNLMMEDKGTVGND